MEMCGWCKDWGKGCVWLTRGRGFVRVARLASGGTALVVPLDVDDAFGRQASNSGFIHRLPNLSDPDRAMKGEVSLSHLLMKAAPDRHETTHRRIKVPIPRLM